MAGAQLFPRHPARRFWYNTLTVKCIWRYKTPAGFDDLVMCGDEESLTGLWFRGSRDGERSGGSLRTRDTPVFRETCRWLDEYFAGREPDFTPNLRIEGATPFRQEVLGGLTGYGGGLGNKVSLLALEGADFFAANISSPKASRPDVDEKLMELLDIVAEEKRDGIFCACWDSTSARVQTSLKRRFEGWVEDDVVWGEGTARWLGAFLSKWTREHTFSYEQLKVLTQWYLERQLASSPTWATCASDPSPETALYRFPAAAVNIV